MTTNPMTIIMTTSIKMKLPHIRHSGESRNPSNAIKIPAFAGMTDVGGKRRQ